MEGEIFKIPLYIKIYKEIAEKINNKEFVEKLPTEKELADMFNTSRTTIRQALLVLQECHITYTKKGSGTYINNKYINNITTGIENFSSVKGMLGSINNTDCQIINQSIGIEEADNVISKLLNIPYKSIVWVLVRSYAINNDVCAISFDFIPKAGQNKDILNQLNTVSDFEAYVDVFLQQQTTIVETNIIATKTEGYVEKIMNIDKSTPLIVLYQVLKDNKNDSLSMNKTYINTMKTELKLFRKTNAIL